MSGFKMAQRLLLATALCAAGAGVAFAQDQQPSQSQSPLQAGEQAQPASQQTMQGQQPQNGQAPEQTQYNSQNQMQAQPIGNANPNEPMEGLPVDQVTDVQGTQVACSGIGKGDETNPQFAGLPVKFAVVGGYGQWLGHETLTVSSRGGQNVSVTCSGPWVLMKLNPGRYSVTANVPDGGSKTVSLTVPSSGRAETTIRFTNLTQGQSNYHATQSPTMSSGT